MTNPVQLKNSAPKILVIKLRHLGDILMAVPVFRALHDKFPYVHISALITKKTEKTLSENPLINELIVFDSEVKKLKPFQRYQKEISFLKIIRSKKIDLSVDLTGGDRATIISFISGVKHRFGWLTR